MFLINIKAGIILVLIASFVIVACSKESAPLAGEATRGVKASAPVAETTSSTPKQPMISVQQMVASRGEGSTAATAFVKSVSKVKR